MLRFKLTLLSKLGQLLGIKKLKKELTNDPLAVIRFLGVNFVTITFLRHIMFFTLFVQAVATAAFFTTLVMTFDSRLLLKFGPFAFITLTAIAGMVISVVFKNHFWAIYQEQISIIKSACATSPKVLAKIKKEGAKTTGWVILNIFFGFMAIIHYFPIGGQNGANLHFAIYQIEKINNKSLAAILSLAFYVSLLPGTCALLMSAFAYIWSVSYLKYHVYAINVILEIDAKNSRGKYDHMLLRNKNYQNNVHEKLKRYVQHHQNYKRVELKIFKLTSTLVLIMTYLSILTYFSMIINFFEEEGLMKYSRIGCVTITLMITTKLGVEAGQSLIDEYFLVSKNISCLAWPSWNLRNRKVMMIFLINTQKPPILGVAGLCTADYGFVITAIKFILSVAGFLVQVVPKKN